MTARGPKARPSGRGNPRTPKASGQPTGAGRRPTFASPAAPARHAGRPLFSFAYADPNFYEDWRDPEHACEVARFLSDIGQLTWTEIRGQDAGGVNRARKHHSMEIGRLVKPAQDRLAFLELDGVFDDVFRFRVSGPKRLWGFLDQGGEVFHLLWWDAKHRAYPTDPN